MSLNYSSGAAEESEDKRTGMLCMWHGNTEHGRKNKMQHTDQTLCLFGLQAGRQCLIFVLATATK